MKDNVTDFILLLVKMGPFMITSSKNQREI